MIKIREIDCCHDDKYDRCGNTAVAVLELDGIKILLCDICLEELNESLNDFNNTLFCHECNNFVMSQDGWNYGGSCKKWAESDNKEITKENAGYSHCVNCMQRCKFIEDNTVYKIYADDCGNDPCSGSCENCTQARWKYIPNLFSNKYKNKIGKTIFLTESEAKEECERLMKENADLRDKGCVYREDQK